MISRIKEIAGSARVILVGSILLSIFLSALDQTIVATAVPKIIGDLGGMRFFSWIFSAYMLTFVASIMIFGRLSDIYGRKPIFISGVVIFLVGSVLCGLSKDILQLIIFRGIQGIGAGSIMVNAMASVADIFPPAERGKYQGLIGSMFALASIVGPAVGGFLTDTIGWHWIFFVNVPIGLFVIYGLYRNLPSGNRHSHQLDILGSLLLVAGVTMLVFTLIQAGTPGWELSSLRIVLMSAGSLMLLAGFIYVEKNIEEPILPLYIFRNPVLVVSLLSISFIAAGMLGTFTILPLFLQSVLGISATSSGFLLVPSTLAVALSSAIAGQVVARTGRYKAVLLLGVFIALIGAALLATVDSNSLPLIIAIYTTILGLGMGANFPIFTIAIQNSFDKKHIGVATSTMQFFRTLGGMMGITLFGSIINLSVVDHAMVGKLASSIHVAFLVSVFLVFVAFISALFLKELPLRKSHDEPVMINIGKTMAAEEGTFAGENEPRILRK